jgi:CubicO group peptidase (beta-lactamase class C family)
MLRSCWFLVGLVLSLAISIEAAEPLPRSRPEETGVASTGILDFVETVDRELDSLHSVMILRNGKVIAEGWWTPYQAQSPHMLFSLSKSFTSTAVGFAVSEGKLSVDDPVLKFFPEYAPENPSGNLKAMRVSDILRMATGHVAEPSRNPHSPWAKQFLNQPVVFKPGTHFLYNTPATYMQSAIVQKVTGEKLIDYLRPRLFEPLGIENPTWEECPQGINTGGYGLKVKTEDIAKFGQMCLQNGIYNSKQVVPSK